MKTKSYTVIKTNYDGEITLKNYKEIEGYKVSPKNSFPYKGIAVESMFLIKPSFIEKIIKKKIKRKLEFYLNYLINLNDNDDGTSSRIALDELTRYKEAIEYKYRKFLDDKYFNLLNKKISLLEHELKSKMITKPNKKMKYQEIIQEEKEETRHRRR